MDYIPYRDDVTITSDGEIETVEAKEVPRGYVLEVTHMSITDETTADLLLELGYKSMTGDEMILHAAKGAERQECYLTGHAWIHEEEKPFGKVTTAVNGDVINLSVHGKLWKKE